MLWLTKVDIIPKREWIFFLSIFVGCWLPFLSSVQHCSTTECQFGVFSYCFVHASHCPQPQKRSWYQDSENWGHGVHLNYALSDFHYCRPARGEQVSCLGISHKHLGWGTWNVFSGCIFEVPPHDKDAKATVSNTSRFHITGNFTKALGAAPWVVNW